MIRFRAMTLLVVALGATVSPAAVPARIVAEAEDFTIQSGWRMIPFRRNYFSSTFAITFLSRQACLGAAEQTEPGKPAVASQVVHVPHDGRYQVLVRYEQPYNFSVEFTIEVVQNGKTVSRRALGRLESPKFWAFSKGTAAPMKRWFWGGGDNIVWEMGDAADLTTGPATIRLVAGPQVDGSLPRVMAAERHIDVVVLTDDVESLEKQKKPLRNYLPFDGWLTQDGDLYVRVTNPSDGLGPCVPLINPYPAGQHSPWGVHDRDWPNTMILRSGRLVGLEPIRKNKAKGRKGEDVPLVEPLGYELLGPHSDSVRPEVLTPLLPADRYTTIPAEEYLQPGHTSGWVPMGQAVDALHVSKWMPGARYAPGFKVEGLDLELEFAIPDGKGGLRPIYKTRVTGKGAYPTSPISFEIPGDVLARPVVRSHLDILRTLLAAIRQFPSHGSTPRRFSVYGLMGFSSILRENNELGRLGTEIAVALGDNTMTRSCPHAEKLGVPQRGTAWIGGHSPTTAAGMKDTLDKLEKDGMLDTLGLVSYGDEQYVVPAGITDEEFSDWLTENKIAVDGEATVTEDPADPLFYYSRLCANEKGMRQWGEVTAQVTERTGGRALAGINYGPASQNMVDELHFIRPFKRRAVSLAWSEDYVWQMPEWSVQVTGYRVSGFRAGTTYHRQPIMLYIMPHSPGNTPRDLRLSFYTAVAHGMTKVHFYCATPSAVALTENYIVSSDMDMFRAVHDITHDAGSFEDYVVDGRVRRAEVGLLLSSVEDIRNPAELASGGHTNAERKAIYFALRHAQVPVDFLSEDDVIDGGAKGYRLIYVTAEYLHSRAVTALLKWVEGGGTLVALCGGGFLDEFGRVNPRAGELYGVRNQGIAKDTSLSVFHAKQDLAPYVPLDRAAWAIGDRQVDDAPVILWKQSIEPGDGTVIGTFANGEPAVVEKAHGRGRAVLFGFMPGLAYLRSGLPLRPFDRGSTDDAMDHWLPTGMDRGIREAIVDAFLPRGFVRPVECGETLVESTVIDTPAAQGRPRRLAVSLMNYTGKPIEGLTVRITDVERARSVRSVEHGTLAPRHEGKTMVLTLPLEIADMLLVDLF